MTRATLSVFATLLIFGMAAVAVEHKSMGSVTDVTKSKVTGSAVANTSGEEVFKANCGRCHAPPSSMSVRITGTVIMHMRMRARLSRQDELLLLKYLAR